MKKYGLIITLIFLGLICNRVYGQSDNQKIIYLSMENVVKKSISDNLSLKSKLLQTEAQNLEYLKSISSFLPTFSYQGYMSNALELPVFVFMGQRFVVGTKYTFQHSLDLTLPLFTGGTRWFNLNIQKNLKKSLSEELKGKEEETVLQSLQAFYLQILSNSLFTATKEAVSVAEANLNQVTKFYETGTATELDLQRAKAQYAAALPPLEKAKSERILSAQRLKFLLDIPLTDSLVVLDSLTIKDFMSDYKTLKLNDFKMLSEENRSDLKALRYQLEATEEGENIALGRFAPTIAFSANVTHQAPLENSRVSWNDYIRSKSLSLTLFWPLFEGGKKIIDYQLAKINTDQMELLFRQADNQRVLEVEQSFYSLKESEKNLTSLKEAMIQAKESLRLSNLLYTEGMSTQLDVLNSQLFYTSSYTEYFQGIFNYNISQLNLLYSTGLLNNIWE